MKLTVGTRESKVWTGSLWGYALFFYAFLYVPILVLLVLSFNDSPAVGLPFRGFTTKWYGEAFAGGLFLQAIGNSVLIGAASASIGTLLALLIALGMRHRFPLKRSVLPLVLIPIVTPGIVAGILMLVFVGLTGIPYGLWTAVLPAHITWVVPFAFLTLYPQVQRFDRSLEEAAMDLGASPWDVFRRVMLPIIRPALVATLLFSFTISFDEFIRTLFVTSSQRTVPVYLWVLVQEQVSPFLPAIGMMMVAISMSVAGIGFLVVGRSYRRPVHVKP
jgi:ABC-type spermidine/putrescine transport system permease subunit II